MKNLKKIRIGIRDSKLSIAQSKLFLKEANQNENITGNYSFDIKTIKTTGDIHNTQRLDIMGGKGLFIKEIEEHIIMDEIDIGIHSMKDVPAVSNRNALEIICWMKRFTNNDVLLTNSGKSFFDLPGGSIIGTSSIRRRAQILNLRKDLEIKLLRGNVDTRIKKLKNNEYDAIILSHAGIQRLGLESEITEILNLENFLPAACQGVIGIQAKIKSDYKNLFKDINDGTTEIECLSERRVLKNINANCNSPVSIFAQVQDDQLKIKSEIHDHSGNKIFTDCTIGSKNSYHNLADTIAAQILNTVGEEEIKKLEIIKDDFNYSP